jgi:hypothetical protein
MTAATATASFGHHSSPPLSSSYPLVYSSSENSYQNTPSMAADSADIQQEYPFDTQLCDSQSQPHAQPQQPSEMLTSAPQQVMYFSPSTENEMEMEGDLDLHYPTSSPSPHALPPPAVRAFVHPSDVMAMSPSPPAFKAPIPSPRAPGSSSPPGLTGESDEDLGSESDDSEGAYPLDGPDGDDDGDFMPNQSMPRSRTRSRRTSSVSSGSGSMRAPRPCRLSAPVPVLNLTKKSRGCRVPTAPVIIVQGGVQKNMRMYRYTVNGCYKCFARGEHLKRHVRSIHTNEKREWLFRPPAFLRNFDLCRQCCLGPQQKSHQDPFLPPYPPTGTDWHARMTPAAHALPRARRPRSESKRLRKPGGACTHRASLVGCVLELLAGLVASGGISVVM